ncbi:MYB-like protein X-like, partial [Trifolium pratense]
EEIIKDIQDQGKGNKRTSRIVDDEEEENTRENWKGIIRRKRCVEDEDDEMRKFNPRDPNFLPLVPEKEKEKVDLRHQMMDERKNAEDWMVDCALRQVVNKLAPARKKKVALLVEAFETVIPKCESHLRNKSGFAHSRHIQACS